MQPIDQGSCDFKDGSFLINHHSSKFDVYRTCGSTGITFLFYHVTPREHMIIGIFDFVRRNPSALVTNVSSLMLIGLV